MKGRTTASIMLISLFMALSLQGYVPEPVGIHKECEDLQDNDMTPPQDWQDEDCQAYPYADGLGETPTPLILKWADPNVEYTPSLWAWYNSQTPPMWDDWCDPITYNDAVSYWTTLAAPSNGIDTSIQDLDDWVDENCP